MTTTGTKVCLRAYTHYTHILFYQLLSLSLPQWFNWTYFTVSPKNAFANQFIRRSKFLEIRPELPIFLWLFKKGKHYFFDTAKGETHACIRFYCCLWKYADLTLGGWVGALDVIEEKKTWHIWVSEKEGSRAFIWLPKKSLRWGLEKPPPSIFDHSGK